MNVSSEKTMSIKCHIIHKNNKTQLNGSDSEDSETKQSEPIQ